MYERHQRLQLFTYINKLSFFGSNYSPGKVVISASASNYGNTNYVLDGIRYGIGYLPDYSGDAYVVGDATNGLASSGVSTNAIDYTNGTETIIGLVTNNLPHLTNAANVAGYISWGAHSSLGGYYAVYNAQNMVQWSGNSGWWVIQTIESYNGFRTYPGMGYFLQWFSSNAFGGTNYSNTPVGAATHVEEPFIGGNENSSVYFGLWASGKDFAICAWNAKNTPYFQAVGDPFVVR